MKSSMTSPLPNEQQNQRIYPPSARGSIRELVKDPLSYFHNLVTQFGDIVCYRPAPETAYLINHPDFVRHILVENYQNYRKDTRSIQVFKKMVGDGLITSDGDTWRWQRKLVTPAFHRNRLDALDHLIVKATNEMLDRWANKYIQGQPVDVAREMASLTLTVTTQALFGVDIGDEVNVIGEWVNQAARDFEKPSRENVQESAHAIRTIVNRIIQERKSEFVDRGDLLSMMILARDEENPGGDVSTRKMNDEQLADQVMTLLIAGYETTANALTWTWYLLSQNIWAISILRQEVQEKLRGRPPRSSDLLDLPYSRMVFEESLRIFPPGWMIGRRAIHHDRIGGFDVEPETVIAICVYTIHRHPNFWEHPDVFDPQHFNPDAVRDRNKFAFIPFGAGPRYCIGNNFGLMEACLILACVSQKFELHLAPGIEVQPQPLFVLRPNRDLMMTLHT